MSGSIAPIDLVQVAKGQGGFVIQGDAAGDQAGYSVASAGDVNGDGFDDLIVGAPDGDDGGFLTGEAYVVFGGAGGFGTAVGGRQVLDLTTLTAAQGFVIQGDASFDYAGRSVASAGDVNGDGFADLILGAPYGDDGGGDAGEAYVVFGGAGGFGAPVAIEGVTRQVLDLTTLSAAQGFIIQGDAAGDRAGWSVASAGDVNGDGFADLILGAPAGDDGGGEAGEAYVVFGGAGGFGAPVAIGGVTRQVVDLTALTPAQGFVIQGDAAGDLAGYSVASAGDVNGDGFADLIVGALGGDDGGGDAGEAYVVFGGAGGFGAAVTLGGITRQVVDLTTLGPAQGVIIQGDAAGDFAGTSVASAGDVNGDGFADLILGAPRGDDGGTNAGEAYVVFGGAGGFGAPLAIGGITRQVLDLTTLGPAQGFIIQGDAAYDRAGISVASAGDVNGDGFADLIIGAPTAGAAGDTKRYAGDSYVVFGRPGGFGAAIDLGLIAAGIGGFVIHGEDAGDRSGRSVAAAGDIDGDGFDDLIIGARYADAAGNAKAYAGESYVIFGRDFGNQATAIGGPGNDLLLGLDIPGLSADQILIGGRGDDTILAGNGSNVLIGGEGDDVFRVARLTDLKADGGGGLDTLLLDAAGVTLDLGSLPRGTLTDIETIDLRGIGANRLVLTKRDLLLLSETTNTLTVLRDADDAVQLLGTGWRDAGTLDGFIQLRNGAAVLRLEDLQRPSEGDNTLNGTALADRIDALGGNDRVDGRAGADTLRGGDGADTVIGGEGDDRLTGGVGADDLSGGEGADRFVFANNALGFADIILDFDRAAGDRIVLRGIDADAGTAADDAFVFIGAAAFTGTAGELRAVPGGPKLQRVEGDVDGDGDADLTIEVRTLATAEADWFVL